MVTASRPHSSETTFLVSEIPDLPKPIWRRIADTISGLFNSFWSLITWPFTRKSTRLDEIQIEELHPSHDFSQVADQVKQAVKEALKPFQKEVNKSIQKLQENQADLSKQLEGITETLTICIEQNNQGFVSDSDESQILEETEKSLDVSDLLNRKEANSAVDVVSPPANSPVGRSSFLKLPCMDPAISGHLERLSAIIDKQIAPQLAELKHAISNLGQEMVANQAKIQTTIENQQAMETSNVVLGISKWLCEVTKSEDDDGLSEKLIQALSGEYDFNELLSTVAEFDPQQKERLIEALSLHKDVDEENSPLNDSQDQIANAIAQELSGSASSQDPNATSDKKED